MTDARRARLYAKKVLDALKTQASDCANIRYDVRALWSDTWELPEFFDAMSLTITRGFRQAWEEGMLMAGLTFEDITPEEQLVLQRMIYEEMAYVLPFGLDIIAGSRENGGKLSDQYRRAELWCARYINLRNQALASAKSDPVLEWVTNAMESCTSCLKLSGQRRRASVWSRLDVHPQHRDKLECMISAGGPDVCQCTFVPTDQPPTRGRLPKLP